MNRLKSLKIPYVIILFLITSLVFAVNPAESHSNDSSKIKRLERELANLRYCINQNYDKFGVSQFRGPYDDPNKIQWYPNKC